MLIKNKKVLLAYKLIAFFICLLGQVFTFELSTFGLGVFLYYTSISNIICLVYFALSAILTWREIRGEASGVSESTVSNKTIPRPSGSELVVKDSGSISPRIKGGVVLAITITLLVFWMVLSGSDFSMTDEFDYGHHELSVFISVTNLIVHLFVPLLAIFDWLLFDRKGLFRARDPLFWLSIPFGYYLLSIIVAQTGFQFSSGGRYPYFFIDPDIIGLPQVALVALGMTLCFLALGYLLYGLDKLFAYLGRRIKMNEDG